MERPRAKRHKISRDDSAGQTVESEASSGENLQENLSALHGHFKSITSISQSVIEQLEAKQNSLGEEPKRHPPDTQLLAGSHMQDASLLQELMTLKARLAEKDEELVSLQSEIKQKTSVLQRQRRQLEEHALDQWSKQNPLTQSQGPDDDSIHEATQTLHYAIRNLAYLDFKGQPLRKPTKAAHKAAFQKLAKGEREYEDYLLDMNLKAYLIEAIIWDGLIEALLKTPLAAYVGTSDVEEAIRPNLQANYKDYPTWRASTGSLLTTNPCDYHDSWKPNGCRFTALVEQLVDLLIQFHRTGFRQDLQDQLNIIVEKAVSLAGLMSRSRAFWVVSLTSVNRCHTVHDHNKTSRRYDFAVVEDHTKVLRVRDTDGQREKMWVSLIVRPLLVKWGDSSGRGCDICQVMRYREVVAIAPITSMATL